MACHTCRIERDWCKAGAAFRTFKSLNSCNYWHCSSTKAESATVPGTPDLAGFFHQQEPNPPVPDLLAKSTSGYFLPCPPPPPPALAQLCDAGHLHSSVIQTAQVAGSELALAEVLQHGGSQSWQNQNLMSNWVELRGPGGGGEGGRQAK